MARQLVICEGDVRLVKNVPRVLDIWLAETLGYAKPYGIRKLVQTNLNELAGYAEIVSATAKNDDPQGRGRPGKEYWLTEEQALLICMRSDAPRAQEGRAEIIAVFQAYRHGSLVPKGSAAVTIDAIGALFDQKLSPVRMQISKIEGDVTFLARRIDDIVPRRDFSKEIVRQWVHVIAIKYNGECPCCREVNISGGHSNDHFRGRELNGREDGWPICQKCNLKLRDAVFKNEKRPHFEVFQDNCRKVWAGHAPRISNDDRQGRLF